MMPRPTSKAISRSILMAALGFLGYTNEVFAAGNVTPAPRLPPGVNVDAEIGVPYQGWPGQTYLPAPSPPPQQNCRWEHRIEHYAYSVHIGQVWVCN